eukprot:scaffold5994_cov54-Phaeocystis_antarctica.AAC.1
MDDYYSQTSSIIGLRHNPRLADRVPGRSATHTSHPYPRQALALALFGDFPFEEILDNSRYATQGPHPGLADPRQNPGLADRVPYCTTVGMPHSPRTLD